MRSQNEEFKRQLEVQKKQHQEKMSQQKAQNDTFREEMEKQNQGLLEIKNLILGLNSASPDVKLEPQDPKRTPKRLSSANFGGDNVDL